MITIIRVHADHGMDYFAFSSHTKEERDAKKAELMKVFKRWKEHFDRVEVTGESWNTDSVIIRMQPEKHHMAWHVSVPVLGTGLEFLSIEPLGGTFVPGKWDIVVQPKEDETVKGHWSDD